VAPVGLLMILLPPRFLALEVDLVLRSQRAPAVARDRLRSATLCDWPV
jgi:hypothetical protein